MIDVDGSRILPGSPKSRQTKSGVQDTGYGVRARMSLVRPKFRLNQNILCKS